MESLGFQIQHIPLEVENGNQKMSPTLMETEFHLEDSIKVTPSVEHQFIPSFIRQSPRHQNNVSDTVVSENLASLRNCCDEDLFVSLHLGDNEATSRRLNPPKSIE